MPLDRLIPLARAGALLVLLALFWTVAATPSVALDVPADAVTVTVAETTPTVAPTPAPTPRADGEVPPLWLVIPFVVILLMIATGPIFYPHHWHHHYPKYAVGLGVLVGVYYVVVAHTWDPVLHALLEYSAFIALVGSLFIAASGIYVQVNAKGTAGANVVMLFLSSIIANLIATTGAAMLFIRAYMRLNSGRLKPYHIVFFIFLVANVGGALTPIGDPPLFLGFLRGVPFFWTLANVWYIWLPTTIILLAIFYAIDSRNKDVAPDPVPGAPLIELEGKKNLIWVALIIACVFIDPNVFDFVPNFYELYHIPFGIREVLMLGIAVAAFKTTPKPILEKNEFTMEPIREVGFLFLGIFLTMQPALTTIAALAAENADSLTVGLFYWGTGILSGVLDNAPTYLNFVAAAMGKFGLDVNSIAEVVQFSEMHPKFLQAISVAAVFFGAMSYIGNAPNFMVKSIAEANGVEVPSFGGYIIRYSIPILLPVYAVVWLIWYSGWIL
ncbi:MAG: sodium:proton antiporter [Bacteroidota bacterium]